MLSKSLLKNKRPQSGFTLVEVVIAMGLMALGGLALMATGDYFLKSRLASESFSSHIVLRNLIQTALSQKATTCVGTVCTSTNLCKTNLRSKASIPVKGALEESDDVNLAIYVGGGAGTLLAESGSLNAAATAREISDHLKYKILLVGRQKSNTPTSTTYTGSVVVIGDRKLLGRSDSLRADVPVEFSINNTGGIIDCSTRPAARMIAIGPNTADACMSAGGIPVPSTIGNLCRFRAPPVIAAPEVDCPIGFVGDPLNKNIDCTQDLTKTSDWIEFIPPCPSGFTPDPVMAKGSLYCNYQGIAGGTPAPDCPLVVLGPDDVPVVPPAGWYLLSYDSVTNLRKCKYSFKCDLPDKVVVLSPPEGDGKTPSCVRYLTQCPNGVPPVWLKVSVYPDPLRCRLNVDLTPPAPAAFGCSQFGFTDLTTTMIAKDPAITQWMSSNPPRTICY